MEKYIITFEDGEHYIANEITQADILAIYNGILTIIRCSDGFEVSDVSTDGTFLWEPLPVWEHGGE